MKPYEMKIAWLFEVDGEFWSCTGIYNHGNSIDFEEVDKNGQEDTHIYGTAELVDGAWRLDKPTRHEIELYRSEQTADDLEKFFNEHGPPDIVELDESAMRAWKVIDGSNNLRVAVLRALISEDNFTRFDGDLAAQILSVSKRS